MSQPVEQNTAGTRLLAYAKNLGVKERRNVFLAIVVAVVLSLLAVTHYGVGRPRPSRPPKAAIGDANTLLLPSADILLLPAAGAPAANARRAVPGSLVSFVEYRDGAVAYEKVFVADFLVYTHVSEKQKK